MTMARSDLTAWRHRIMVDEGLDYGRRLCVVAWTFLPTADADGVDLPADERELVELTEAYLPRARLWATLNGYTRGRA